MVEKLSHGGRRAGSGRKRRNTRQISLRLSPDTIERLRAKAVSLAVTMSELAEKLLRKIL